MEGAPFLGVRLFYPGENPERHQQGSLGCVWGGMGQPIRHSSYGETSPMSRVQPRSMGGSATNGLAWHDGDWMREQEPTPNPDKNTAQQSMATGHASGDPQGKRSPARQSKSKAERRGWRMKLDRAGDEARDLAAARDGDRDAYGRLVRSHFGGLYGLLVRLVGSPEDAEDLCQETFVRGWKALGDLRPGSPLRPWLTRIAVHLFYDYLRRRGRGASVVELDSLMHEPEGREAQPFAELQSREAQAVLAAALERLPERQQVAFALRVLEGREYDEAAAIMGLKPATVRTLVFQGRRLLMRLLQPWMRGLDERGGSNS